MSALTLEQFRATGRDVAVLADIPECDGWEGGGRVYNGCLVIQEGEGAKWCLTIANDSWESDDLDALEAELYEWALAEGALDVVPPVFNPATDSVMDKPHEASEVIDALVAALRQLLNEVDDMTARVGWAGNGGRDMARAALKMVQS